MNKIKVRSPAYSLVAADLSAAEVRTAANAAKSNEMINAYKEYNYEKEFTSCIELYSYERLNTPEGYKGVYIINEGTKLLDKNNIEVLVTKVEDVGDKNKIYLNDNFPHIFIINKPGQDLYSLIASRAYNNKYEDNLEFYPEGTKIIYEGKEVICGPKEFTNKAGKIRRQDSKSLLIGLIYGRGVNSICTQINESRIKKGQPTITLEDAQELINNIYKAFPRLKQWMDETHDFIHKNGYIDDVFGRRRRLPDGMLPKYSITSSATLGVEGFNPLLGCPNKENTELIEKYKAKIENNGKPLYQKEYEEIKKQAKVEGIEITNNNGLIAQAERQSVNFQAQAASSEINKLSMIAIDKDPRLKELGFQLLLTIHDEVIGQCPSENAEEVAKIIPEIMISRGGDKMICPLISDSTIVRHWYEDDVSTVLNDEFTSLVKGNPDKGIKPLPEEEAVKILYETHEELLPEQIYNFCIGHCGYLWDNDNF